MCLCVTSPVLLISESAARPLCRCCPLRHPVRGAAPLHKTCPPEMCPARLPFSVTNSVPSSPTISPSPPHSRASLLSLLRFDARSFVSVLSLQLFRLRCSSPHLTTPQTKTPYREAPCCLYAAPQNECAPTAHLRRGALHRNPHARR